MLLQTGRKAAPLESFSFCEGDASLAAVPEDQRLSALQRLGVSEPLIRLASGECVHPALRDSCLGPPYYAYHGAVIPDGPPLIPLWDYSDTVVGVWERADGPEFVEYSIEADEVWMQARTEQGFWATRFNSLHEAEVPEAELRAAAAAVRFRFLDRLVASHESCAEQLGTFEGHATWLRELVESIDREAPDAEPAAAPDGGA